MIKVETKIKNAQKLIHDIEKKLKTWNERSQFKLKGVGNLSRADLDSLELYCQHFDGYGFPGFMEPRGEIKDVLVKYQVLEENENASFF